MSSLAASGCCAPSSLLRLITGVLSLSLVTSESANVFLGRFRMLRAKLESLESSLGSLSSSPHWSHNPILVTLLPSLLSALQRFHSLSLQCQPDSPPSFPSGKLRFQSDLDMVSSLLSSHIHDLDFLLRSGVLNHSSAIVLSLPPPGSDSDQLEFYLKDLFTRIQIGGLGFKIKALESLVQILRDDPEAAPVVSQEADLGYLISLLDFNSHHSAPILDLAVSSLSLLASSSSASRTAVFDAGGLGYFLRILDTGSVALKEKAATAVEAITADPNHAWGITAHGGVHVIIDACSSGSPATQAAALGTIMNVSGSQDVSTALQEEGLIPVLLQSLASNDPLVQQRAAGCVALLATSSASSRTAIAQTKGVHRLMQCLLEYESNAENILRAIVALTETETVTRVLSSSTPFVLRLGDFLVNGNLTLQQISVSLLAKLSISDGNKRAMSISMGTLVKLMERRKPAGVGESAAATLVALLSVKSNRKEFVRDEKSLTRVVQMLDPRAEVAKGPSVAVVAALLAGYSSGPRKRLVAAGARQHLLQLAEDEVPYAKTAAQKLAGNSILGILFSLSKQ